ncbi:MAG: C13 family peptidase [Alphaproteobacteria bacterium]
MPPIRVLLVWIASWLLLVVEAVAAVSSPSGWQAVLVAGDNAEPVFDNAVAAFRGFLASGGVPTRNIHVLTATQGAGVAAEPASSERVLGRIAALRPGPGEACLVFITSHGQRGEGIWLAYGGEYLRPAELAQALSAGCARAPTVVIVSGCFTGGFTAVQAPNRIVVTASRIDRPSFGCSVERTYAVFDECLLASLPREATWQRVIAATQNCVRAQESKMQAAPSEPQVIVGAKVRSLRVR